MTWEDRIAEQWATMDDHPEDEFVQRIDALAGELPQGSPVGLFERACARDSTGHSDLAVPLYRQALDAGLTGIRRRRAVIQMASSLRNLGRSDESVTLLRAERDAGTDELDDAVRGFLALALVDVGREREAASIAIAALAPHLPRYQRSMGNYARALLENQDPYATRHPDRYAATQIQLDPDRAAASAGHVRSIDLSYGVLRAYQLVEPGLADAVRLLRSTFHGVTSLEASGGFGHPRNLDMSWSRIVDALHVTLEHWQQERCGAPCGVGITDRACAASSDDRDAGPRPREQEHS